MWFYHPLHYPTPDSHYQSIKVGPRDEIYLTSCPCQFLGPVSLAFMSNVLFSSCQKPCHLPPLSLQMTSPFTLQTRALIRSHQFRNSLPFHHQITCLRVSSLFPFKYRWGGAHLYPSQTPSLSSGHPLPTFSRPWATNLFPLSLLHPPPSIVFVLSCLKHAPFSPIFRKCEWVGE